MCMTNSIWNEGLEGARAWQEYKGTHLTALSFAQNLKQYETELNITWEKISNDNKLSRTF